MWERISTICNIINGFTPSRTNFNFWNKKDVYWMTVEDINMQGKYLYTTKQFISNDAIKSKGRIVPQDSVFICCTSASIGKVAINKVDMISNQQFNGLVIKTSHSINNEFLFLYCSQLKTTLMKIAGVTTFPFVSTTKLGDILIPIPPYKEQGRIVDKIDFIYKIINF